MQDGVDRVEIPGQYQFSMSTSQGFQPQQELQAKIKGKLKENWYKKVSNC
jgi:hypothetical protein